MWRIKGFSFMELIIIIVVLGILAAIAIPRYVDLSSSAVDTVKKADEANTRTAYVLAIAENQTEPTVQQLGSYLPTGSVVIQPNGMQFNIQGNNYLVPTYRDPDCTSQTDSLNHIVKCVGNISP